MGKLLQFETKAERAERLAKAIVAVAESVETVPVKEEWTLYAKVLQHCRDLSTLFQATGKWDPTCEQVMIQVVLALKNITARVSAPGDRNGTENAG
jgi:hypothetical protein